MDHRAKDRLRVHAYLRYMDDMLLFDDDASRLADNARAIEEACWHHRLRLHPWQVRPTRAGVTFVGFRILPDHVRIKATSARRAESRLRRKLTAAQTDRTKLQAFLQSLRSTFAHWGYADTWRLRQRLLEDLGLLADGE